MEIKDHKFTGIEYNQTPNVSSSPLNPDTIIVHYTAGSTASSAIRSMTKKGNASAHLVVDVDGTITQLAAFNQKAWHAGRSSYGGRSSYNNYSVGIEIVNPGWLKKDGNEYKTYWGKVIPENDVFTGKHRNPQTRMQYWHRYTQEQIDAVTKICETICDYYDIQYILGHEEVSPGRKQDPGPAFPLDEMRDKILNTVPAPGTKGEILVDLNIRSAPNDDADKIALPLDKGTIAEILKEREEWLKVKAPLFGWVSKKFIEMDNTDSEWDAKVTVDALNIREEPGGRKVAKALAKDTKVKILEQEDEWSKVETRLIGWVMKKFVEKKA